MSHFVGLCFGNLWEDNLERYNENQQVEEYIKYTKEEAIDCAKQDHARSYENAVKYLQDPTLNSERRMYFEKVIDKGLFMSYEDAWKEVQQWGYNIDEEENLLSTYNPDSKWDWYVVGGRWDGFLRLKERGDTGERLRVNAALFKEVDWEYMIENDHIPFNYVTEEGAWYEKGEMGWWGITTNEKEKYTWKEEFKSYLKLVDDNCWITVVDFHI